MIGQKFESPAAALEHFGKKSKERKSSKETLTDGIRRKVQKAPPKAKSTSPTTKKLLSPDKATSRLLTTGEKAVSKAIGTSS